MARRDDDEFDDFDDRPRKGKSAFPLWLILLLCVIPLGVVVVVGGVFAMVWSRSEESTREAEAARADVAAAETNKAGMVYTRGQFKTLVMGKTPEEVIAAVGKPDTTSDLGSGRMIWHYKKRTIDTITGKTDLLIAVSFWTGKVEHVSY